jgi:YVTN family beta-propeller protein
MTTRATIPTGSGPHGVVIDPSGHWAWVTNSFDNTVSTVDLTTLDVAATTAVGNGPNGISYATAPPAPAPAPTTSLTITALPTAEGTPQSQHGGTGH